MKHSFDLRPWLKPVLTCVLGLYLIFRPGSLTTSIAWVVGALIALAGAGKLVSFISGSRKDFLGLCIAIVLLVLGFSIINKPVNLEKQVGRVIGIVLLLQGIRGYTNPYAAHEKITAVLCGAAGVFLILVPLAVSRLAVMICGIVVLLIGAGMVIDLLLGNRGGHDSGDPDIIDAR